MMSLSSRVFGWLAAGALLAAPATAMAMQSDASQASASTNDLGGNYDANLTVDPIRCLFRNLSQGGHAVIQATPNGPTLILHLEQLDSIFQEPLVVTVRNGSFSYAGPMPVQITALQRQPTGQIQGSWSSDSNSFRADYEVDSAACSVRGTLTGSRTDAEPQRVARSAPPPPPPSSNTIYSTTPSGGAASAVGTIDAAAFANLVGTEASFQTSNFNDRFIRHRNSLGYAEAVSGDLGRDDSTFRIDPGLAGRCISLESHNYPGQYLRHQAWRVKLAPREDNDLYKQDATFCMVPGLASSAGVSFESVNYPHHFIRHRNGELWVDDFDGSALFRADATFNVTNPGGAMNVR
jgi:hypothetical protein